MLFLTGASLGALVRRSGHAVKNASTRVRRERAPGPPPLPEPSLDPPSFTRSRSTRRRWTPFTTTRTSSRHAPADPPRADVRGRRADRGHPDLALRGRRASPGPSTAFPSRRSCTALHRARARTPRRAARIAEALLVCLANFGVEATVVGQISGPRVTRYELQLAPGTKVGKVAQLRDDLCYALATTEIRILAPIPGKQAVGVEVPNLSPNLVTLGDIFGEIPPQSSPLSVWLGKGIDGDPGLLRPRADAASADRRHDRLGQVGLHQRDPHLDPAPRHARPGADDPDRPEAHRAQPLRVDPAPAHAGRVEPEGGERRPPQRRDRDGAPLRAPRPGARPRPPGGEPGVPQAGRARAPVPARRHRRARRPDDGEPPGRRGRDHPPRPEVARRRDPPRARDPASVGRRHHRDDQGERPLADRLRGLVADRLPRDPRLERRREPPRPGRHALQAARHVAPPARPGRIS